MYVADGTSFIRSQNVYDNRFSHAGLARITDQAADSLKNVTVRTGDVLVCITGESVTRTCLVDDAVLPARVSQHVAIIRPSKAKLDSKFLMYALLNSPVKNRLNVLSSAGATRRALTKSHLQGTIIALPPLDEQKRIAGVLGALDELIETNLSLLGNLTETCRAVFLSRWDGETRVPIGQVSQVVAGQSPPGNTYNEDGVGLPFHQGVRDFGDRYPTTRVYCDAPKRVAKQGDLLLAVRAPVGLVNVSKEETAIGRGLAAIRFDVPSRGYHALTADRRLWDPYQGEGTVFAAVNKANISAAKIPWVEDDRLDDFLHILDAAHLEISREVDYLRRTRDELLPLLLSGKVSPGEIAA